MSYKRLVVVVLKIKGLANFLISGFFYITRYLGENKIKGELTENSILPSEKRLRVAQNTILKTSHNKNNYLGDNLWPFVFMIRGKKV